MRGGEQGGRGVDVIWQLVKFASTQGLGENFGPGDFADDVEERIILRTRKYGLV